MRILNRQSFNSLIELETIDYIGNKKWNDYEKFEKNDK